MPNRVAGTVREKQENQDSAEVKNYKANRKVYVSVYLDIYSIVQLEKMLKKVDCFLI